MRPPQLAAVLDINPKGIGKLFRRTDIHCKLLKQLCKILEYDFFQHLSEINAEEVQLLHKKSEELEKENALLKRENALLVQANNWLSKGK